tara:strand:+ start:4013 stop:5152 length:1140 start_codon:yes stop_codon:yes gene_type:complete
MSDKSQEDKTEEATPKRIVDARKKGQLPRGRELTGAAVVLAVSGVLAMQGQSMVSDMGNAMHFALTQPARFDFETSGDMMTAMARVAGALFTPLLPVMLAAVFAALAGGLLIGGWNISGKAVMPDLKKLNPLSGLKRMFSLNALVELLKAIFKAFLVGGVAVWVIVSTREHWLGLGQMATEMGVMKAFALAITACIASAAAYVLIGLIDAPYQIWKHQRDLRMTRQETRDESKESEGRPEVKARLRQLQQEMARGRMMDEVPSADVILVNPVHVAVALKYDAGHDRAPRVVAKGAGLIAEQIKKVASEHRVPVLSSAPLARVLYRTTDLGHEIPPDLFTAIAQILTWVYRVQRNPASVGSGPPQPEIPKHLQSKAMPWQ